MTPQPEEPREPYPFWGYKDLALFICALIPSIVIAFACVALFRSIAPVAFAIKAVGTLTFQALFYGFVVGALYMIVVVRYGKPFAEAFRLRSENQRPWIFVLWGPFLAISVSMLGVLLRAPLVPSPVDMLISGRASMIMLAVFTVFAGPFMEELVFRGFLQPLLSRTLGAAAGILISAAAFGLMHGKQSQWAWQLVLVLSLAGAVFGYVRHRTGSTTAAIALHAGYNATFFAGYLATR